MSVKIVVDPYDSENDFAETSSHSLKTGLTLSTDSREA